jgi:hypothetical protein
VGGSSELVKALQILQLVVYSGLFLVAIVNWRRRPGQTSAWLVATFGVLAAVVVAGQLLPEDSSNPAVHWATKRSSRPWSCSPTSSIGSPRP